MPDNTIQKQITKKLQLSIHAPENISEDTVYEIGVCIRFYL